MTVGAILEDLQRLALCHQRLRAAAEDVLKTIDSLSEVENRPVEFVATLVVLRSEAEDLRRALEP